MSISVFWNRSLLVLSILTAPTLFFSCKTSKKTVNPEVTTARLRNTRNILEQFRLQNSDFEWFSAKINATVTYDDRPFSFNVTLHIRRDSLLWMSLSQALGIELARVLVLNDTLKFINRLNETYLISDFDSLNKIFHTDIAFNALQSLFTATDLSYFMDYEEGDTINGSDEVRFRSGMDSSYYFIGTISKRKLRKTSHRIKKEMRVKQRIQKKDPELGYIQSLWIHPAMFKPVKMYMDELRTSRKLKINYGNYQDCRAKDDTLKTGGNKDLFPYYATYELVAEKPVKLELNYSRITLDRPQNVRFSIPAKYSPLK